MSHCDLCAYWERCEKVRRGDDHLCYVAGIQACHMEQLRGRAGVNSLQAFAETDEIPTPARGSLETLLKLRDQARIQLKGRTAQTNEFELKTPFDAEHGFQRLTRTNILMTSIWISRAATSLKVACQEYLTGYVTPGCGWPLPIHGAVGRHPRCRAGANFRQPSSTPATAVRAKNPKAHIYHFAPYEPAALKRLMGRFATRERELDVLLTEEAFVDLHSIVRRSLIASVESYSIKNLEPFFGYQRESRIYVRRAPAGA